MNANDVHDWTLVSICMDWSTGNARVQLFDNQSVAREILTIDVSNLVVPRTLDWWPSVSVNEVIGPIVLDERNSRLQIEIQSGDVIDLTARNFLLP
jgi:hypothetical protein